jgi:hypothetical protein
MDNFDDKLNNILSSPEAMEKIMGMARSMSGGTGDASNGGNIGSVGTSNEGGGTDPLSALLGGGIDPQMLGKAMQLFGAYNRSDPQKAALMQAVKPYLRPARRERVDQALQTLKLANVAKEALGTDALGGLLSGILGRK